MTVADTACSLILCWMSIAQSMSLVVDSFSLQPGVEEQWMLATIGALQELIAGDAPESLRSVLSQAAMDSPGSVELIDAVFASSGAAGEISDMSEMLVTLADALVAENTARVGPQWQGVDARSISDLELAKRMQTYAIVKLFGNAVVGPTASGWANTMGLATGAIATFTAANPAIGVTGAAISAVLAVRATQDRNSGHDWDHSQYSWASDLYSHRLYLSRENC